MTNPDRSNFDDVFRALNRWRHLPFYRLEPTLAPFFGLFLRDIIYECLDVETHPAIVPEFPLRLATLCDRNNDSNRSVKVDYAVFENNLSRAFFVELKTDKNSFDEDQYKYLRQARCIGFRSLMCGIRSICKTTGQKRKYVHLFQNLQRADIDIVSPNKQDELCNMITKNDMRGWKNIMEGELLAVESLPKIEIVYITPDGKTAINYIEKRNHTEKCCKKQDCAQRLNDKISFHEISFDCVADIVERRGDLGHLFANYLRKWTKRAGKEDPRTIWGAA